MNLVFGAACEKIYDLANGLKQVSSLFLNSVNIDRVQENQGLLMEFYFVVDGVESNKERVGLRVTAPNGRRIVEDSFIDMTFGDSVTHEVKHELAIRGIVIPIDMSGNLRFEMKFGEGEWFDAIVVRFNVNDKMTKVTVKTSMDTQKFKIPDQKSKNWN